MSAGRWWRVEERIGDKDEMEGPKIKSFLIPKKG
jgi:hypothetical protein